MMLVHPNSFIAYFAQWGKQISQRDLIQSDPTSPRTME
jgi:hypothetical protein